MSEHSNRRILLIDDTPSIHDDFRKILTPVPVEHLELDEVQVDRVGVGGEVDDGHHLWARPSYQRLD